MDIPSHGSYSYLLLDPKWKKKRLQILERDNYKCQNCGSGDDLNIHHKLYHFFTPLKKFFPPWEYDDKYLITLCKNCHQKGHRLWKIPIQKIDNMKFFKIFGNNRNESFDDSGPKEDSSPEVDKEKFVEGEAPESNDTIQVKTDNKENYSLKEIEDVYEFLHRDYGEKGYNDALVNHDDFFRKINKSAIEKSFIILLREVQQNYQNKILELEHNIQTAQNTGLLDISRSLEKDKKIYENKQKDLQQMQNDLSKEDSHLKRVLITYDRGFNTAIAAKLLK